ncbi:MAG: hypothetical protein DRO88_13465 [Promethearchaeia archaeon]|nr:MAG: hypothetical protein DRO88_13465 [Candidatus Lokiarchaeia archaeon]
MSKKRSDKFSKNNEKDTFNQISKPNSKSNNPKPSKKLTVNINENKSENLISYKGITIRGAHHSESYDEYLECIYRLSLNNPAGWVKNGQIAKKLNVKAPSVTNMLEKLSNANLVDWKPRSGIRLTELGRERAKEIVLYHSIIEIFLSRVLGMTDPEQINEIACDFEHHITKEFSDHLIDLLGISKDLKNVNNFILEDKLPMHIESRPIYSEKQVFSLLHDFYSRLKARIESTPLTSSILKEEYQNFVASLQH